MVIWAATTTRITEPSLGSEVFSNLVNDKVELVIATLREASRTAELATSRSLNDLGWLHPLGKVLMVFLVKLLLSLNDAISYTSAEFDCW
jgi:hypothetical protein